MGCQARGGGSGMALVAVMGVAADRADQTCYGLMDRVELRGEMAKVHGEDRH